MEEEALTPDEVYDREERCSKAIRTVTKAIIMRLSVTGLLLWVLIAVDHSPMVIGLTVFVTTIDLAGLLPLGKELRKRLNEQRYLRSLEPDQ